MIGIFISRIKKALGIHLKPNQAKIVKDPTRAVAQLLNGLLETCPYCRSALPGHEYSLLASWFITKEKDDALIKFFEVIKEHQWVKLRDFKSWFGRTDDVEVYAVRCSGHNLAIVAIKTHFELMQGPRLLYTEALPTEESKRLLDTFKNLKWHPF